MGLINIRVTRPGAVSSEQLARWRALHTEGAAESEDLSQVPQRPRQGRATRLGSAGLFIDDHFYPKRNGRRHPIFLVHSRWPWEGCDMELMFHISLSGSQQEKDDGTGLELAGHSMLLSWTKWDGGRLLGERCA